MHQLQGKFKTCVGRLLAVFFFHIGLLVVRDAPTSQPHVHIEYLNEDVQNEEPEHEQSHEPLRFNHAHPKPRNPPYPEILNQEKTSTHLDFDFLGEIENVCVKILFFQAIKYVPIYFKEV